MAAKKEEEKKKKQDNGTNGTMTYGNIKKNFMTRAMLLSPLISQAMLLIQLKLARAQGCKQDGLLMHHLDMLNNINPLQPCQMKNLKYLQTPKEHEIHFWRFTSKLEG